MKLGAHNSKQWLHPKKKRGAAHSNSLVPSAPGTCHPSFPEKTGVAGVGGSPERYSNGRFLHVEERNLGVGEKCSPHFTDVKTEVTQQRGLVTCPRSISEETVGLATETWGCPAPETVGFQHHHSHLCKKSRERGKGNKKRVWGRGQRES